MRLHPALLTFPCGLCFLAASVPAQTWQLVFEARPTVASVQPGGQFTTDLHVSGVNGPTLTGYQMEVLFDPARVQLLAITRGSYLVQGLPNFFGNVGGFPDRARVGALVAFTNPVPVPTNGTEGVVATLTFQVLPGAAPLGTTNLDVTSFCVLSVPGPGGGAISVGGTQRDAAVQIAAPGDLLAASGTPNRNGTLRLAVHAPAHAGRFLITMGSFSNTGIPIPGAGLLPLGFDPLLQAALANAAPFSGSVRLLGATGDATTLLFLPDDRVVVGLRLYFASLVFDLSRFHAVSNSTWVVCIQA